MRNSENEPLLAEIYKVLEQGETQTLKELVEERRLALGIKSDLALSKALGIDKTTFNRILNGDTQKVDLFSVLILSQFLGLNVDKMIQVCVASMKPEFIRELEKARKANYILRTFDLKGLRDIGFIDNVTDFEAIESKVVEFYGLDSIFDYSRDVGHVLFSKRKDSDDKMREFWVRSAEFMFERINNPNPYDRDTLMTLVPKIKSYTRYEEKGMLTVIRALYNAGITVIAQSYLTKTKVRGGTFAVNGKPCIVITDYNDSYPSLWFALLHEIFHVLFDFDELKQIKYHITEDDVTDLFLFREDDADAFAREVLFSKENMNFIKHLINAPLSVAKYAEAKSVHPGIIYSFFCWQEYKEKGKRLYPIFQHHFGKSDKALNMIRSNPWGKKTIFDEIELIKSKLQSI